MSRASATIGILVMGSLVQPGEWRRAWPLPAKDTTVAIAGDFGRLPLRFERNDGQVDRQVRYVARGPGYTMFVKPTEVLLSLGKTAAPSVLRVKLVKARPEAAVEGLEELPGRTNYFIGNDPKKWRTNVRGYARVQCTGVYAGIDLVYYGNQSELEYDFVVAPGSDPRRIRLSFEGARKVRLDAAGNLVIALEAGDVVQRAPRMYQKAGSKEETVRGHWVLRGKNEAAFEVGPYDPRHALVIDPVLGYSTYLGGSSTESNESGAAAASLIAVDMQGSAYVTGTTYSTDFPTQDPYQIDQPDLDVFVTKLSPSGDALVYSTYLGGNALDLGFSIAVDSLGSAYVTGVTFSTDFPTQNPYQTDQPNLDVFVTKLSPSGEGLVYSTYLGGSHSDHVVDIAVDSLGSAYVTGGTASTDFPTQNPYQMDQPDSDVFVTKFSASGDSLVYSTYLGGSSYEGARGITLDGLGSAYITGATYSMDFPTQGPYQTHQSNYDAFVTKLSASGSSLVYSTYLGGTGIDYGYDIAVDDLGTAYITGSTLSADFPTHNPYQTDQAGYDAFVTSLSPSGDSLVYSTYLGGSDGDGGHGIAVAGDGSRGVYVIGSTASTDFPTEDPYQGYRGIVDAFVTKLSHSGNRLVYSTYLGGSNAEYGRGIAVDSRGSAYVTGFTTSTDFPTRNPYQRSLAGSDDAFVTKLVVPPGDFFTLSPCRLIDTRDPIGELGGPALVAGDDRNFRVVGKCGIPSTTRAVAVNIAVTSPSASGHLRLYPAGPSVPVVSSINYSAGQTRSNNAVVSLNSSGALTVRCAQASGTTHFILDVNGYFE